MKENFDIEKKKLEKNILSNIYELKSYLYIPNEKPDFVVSHKHHSHQWGVEITSIFFHESSARLKRIKNYALDLIDQGTYRHKDDKELLKVETATLIRDGKEASKFKAILNERPKIDNYLKIVFDVIKRKNNNYQKYRKDLTHINLIINDEEDYFRSINSKDFQKLFFNDNITHAIVKSRFREMYFLTTINESRNVFFPLKLMCFLTKFYKFNYMYREFYKDSKTKSSAKYLNYFIKYLYDIGMQDGYILLENKHLSFYYAHSEITFENGKTNIFEKPDLIIPSEAKLFNEVVYDVTIEKEFEEYLNEEDKKFSYWVDLCFDSKKTATQSNTNENGNIKNINGNELPRRKRTGYLTKC